MNNTFSSQTLVEKLSKLNSSQQSIETLSHWCIFHRKKAKQIVETWEKLLNSSSKEQRVSFLYLANDILQNSRRKGSEFVNEFWKVLPGALKNVCENDEHGKNVVMRLVDIWDDRKVFGSRGRVLKDDILGQAPPLAPSDNNGKSSNPIKVVRKDGHSLRIKLAVGGMPEKIVTAYQSVLDEHFKEDTALNKCKAAVRYVGKMEKEIDDAFSQGIQQGSPLMNEIQEQETILKQCIEQLMSVEETRAALVAQLKEALQEQESKLELIRTQLQAAQTETERAINMKQRLVSAMATTGPAPSASPDLTIASLPTDTTPITEPNLLQIASMPPPQTSQPVTSFVNSLSAPAPQLPQPPIPFPNSSSSLLPQPSHSMTSFSSSFSTPPSQPLPVTFTNSFNSPPPQPSQPVTSLVNSITAEEQHKKAAAAVAAKLTASTSSAQMLTSVLSSLVAEEAASMNGGLGSGGFTSSPPIFPANKRSKFDKPMSVSDMSNSLFGPVQPQQRASLPLPLPQVSSTSMQPLSQPNQPPPPFPPLPPMPPPPVQQYMQTSGGMVGVVPYSFRGGALPPPPLSTHVSMELARPSAPQPPPPPLPSVPPPQQQQQQQQQQLSTTTGFFQPSGIGFYGQLQTAPPVPAPWDQ